MLEYGSRPPGNDRKGQRKPVPDRNQYLTSVSSPVEGGLATQAYDGVQEPSGPARIRILGNQDLSETSEADIVRSNGGKGVLLPYLRHNLDADPVIVVHGIKGNPAQLKAIIAKYASDDTKQVWVFLYDDFETSIDRSGDDLARQIRDLRAAKLMNKSDVKIIAHSMGGIVSQAALNSMTTPDWFEHRDDQRGLDDPMIDQLSSVQLVAVDTPWAGGTHRGSMAPTSRLALNRKKRKNKNNNRKTWRDMVSRSPLFTQLHNVELPKNVSIHHIEAAGKNRPRPGAMYFRGLHDLKPRQLEILRDFVLANGEPPQGTWLQQRLKRDQPLLNQLLAFRQSVHFEQLKAKLESEPTPEMVTHKRVQELLRECVPNIEGDHTGVLTAEGLRQALEAIDVASDESASGG